ncbi:MAG: BTAD domain-containing putative transcriptional regulator [Gemmatimonadaceae bacterium]
MIRLLTFGGLAIQGSESPIGARLRMQELALMARLAVAGARGLTRDKLVSCFWPEKDQQHAFHSLSQILHRIKKELMMDDVFVGTMILRLNPNRISTDVADFERAVESGNHEHAATLYAGPLLEGVFMSVAPEFERWVDRERRRFSDAHVRCLRKLAIAATESGNHDAAAMWWKRIGEVDPLNSGVAMSFVRSLAAAGDSAGALREARAHESLLSAELGYHPSSAFCELVDELRRSAVNT